MRPKTGDRPAAPCRTPLRPVLDTVPSRLVTTPRVRAFEPRLRSGPGADTIRPVPPPDLPRRLHRFGPPLPITCSPAPGRLPPPPQHNRGADAALPAAPSGTTTHAPRPDPLAARASPGRDIAIFPIFFRIIGFARDTPSRHYQAIACFCTRFFVSLAPLKIRRSG